MRKMKKRNTRICELSTVPFGFTKEEPVGSDFTYRKKTLPANSVSINALYIAILIACLPAEAWRVSGKESIFFCLGPS
jgi:hypothetical protein